MKRSSSLCMEMNCMDLDLDKPGASSLRRCTSMHDSTGSKKNVATIDASRMEDVLQHLRDAQAHLVLHLKPTASPSQPLQSQWSQPSQPSQQLLQSSTSATILHAIPLPSAVPFAPRLRPTAPPPGLPPVISLPRSLAGVERPRAFSCAISKWRKSGQLA